MIRAAEVVKAIPEEGKVRVRFSESDDGTGKKFVSHALPVIFPKTLEDKYYVMPDIGEQVLCLFLATGLEQGFVVGSFYSNEDRPPVEDPEKLHVRFKDGSIIEYDRKEKKLTMNLAGDMEAAVAEGIKIEADVEITGKVKITGDVTVKGDLDVDGNFSSTGNIEADGDVRAGNVSLKNHTHSGVESGSGSTSPPAG